MKPGSFFLLLSATIFGFPFGCVSSDPMGLEGEIISTLCSGELSYSSPCDSITRNYFGEQVRWVKEISIASSINEKESQE
jgi:hypothetical protein